MVVEFLEPTHTYLVDGIIVPSVTTIIKKIMPDKYKGIDTKILHRKAEYGTKGHHLIEIIGRNQLNDKQALELISDQFNKREINQDMFISIREYLRLTNKHMIEPLECEKVVNYGYEFVGTLDMIANVNGKRCLIDIKFTAELDHEYLAWQLGMYKMATGEEFDGYYCLWLPKGKVGKLEPIEIKSEEEILKKLEEIKEIEND